MPAEQQNQQQLDLEARRRTALELCFISVLGLFVLGAFVAALSYDFVSARAPLFIMVPLLLLIGVQFNRTRKRPHSKHLISELGAVFKGENQNFNSVAGFIGVMALLLLLIYVAGHYVGISVFMLVLFRYISGERWIVSLLVPVGVTVLIFILFEYGFNIELYRGYLFRLLSDYGLF